MEPVLSDKENDKGLSVSGGDLKSVYMAQNGNILYIRFEVYSDTINANNHYRVWFDNDKDGVLDGDLG